MSRECACIAGATEPLRFAAVAIPIALAALIGLAALGVDPAVAAPVAAPQSHDCMDTAVTQGELNVCADSKARAADVRLNRSWRALICYLNPFEKAQLQDAERSWITFRDKDCAFVAAGGGSIAPMNMSLCLADRDDQRAKDLDAWPYNAPRDALAPCKAEEPHDPGSR